MRLLALLTAVLGVALLAPATDARKKRPRKASCALKDSKTLLANRQVRVYRVIRNGPEYMYYACLQRTGKRRFLTSHGCPRDDCERGPGLLLAGRYVAVDVMGCNEALRRPGDPLCIGTLESIDMASRKRLYKADIRGGHEAAVGPMLLTPRGAIGYVSNNAVQKLDSAGHAELDPGPGIDRESLALSPSGTLYWTARGTPHSYVLR